MRAVLTDWLVQVQVREVSLIYVEVSNISEMCSILHKFTCRIFLQVVRVFLENTLTEMIDYYSL